MQNIALDKLITCITIQYIIYIILQQKIILIYKTISKHCKTNVNGLHLHSAFLTIGHPKRCTIFASHSRTHSHTDGGVSHARRQPARREQLGLGALLKHTSTLSQEEPEIGRNLQITSQPALPPELLPLHNNFHIVIHFTPNIE